MEKKNEKIKTENEEKPKMKLSRISKAFMVFSVLGSFTVRNPLALSFIFALLFISVGFDVFKQQQSRGEENGK